MRSFAKILAAAAVVALSPASEARGEEKHGVAVYPGAKLDAAATDVVRQMTKNDAGCYRTADPVAKVTAFYRKQPGVSVTHEDAETSLSKKGAVDITVQRPWMDLKTGTMNQDTLISIVKAR